MPRCSVCGKVFPEGQGIVIRFGDEDLVFHKRTCAVKFLRELIPLLGQDCSNAAKSALEIFSKAIEERKKEKRIPGTVGS